MPKKPVVPDAWDDDWESQADTPDVIEERPNVTKAERLAKHAEANKQIWESAEKPETFHFLATQSTNTIPLKSEFKPALKVLSRKPAPRVVAKQDLTTGVQQLAIEDDVEDEVAQNSETLEERQARAVKEREEKQKKYEEVRARLFGTDQNAIGVTSSSRGSDINRGKRKGKEGDVSNPSDMRRPQTTEKRELFDPTYSPKPGSVTIQKREKGKSPGRNITREDNQIIRAPRGPDASGKGFDLSDRGRDLT